jgi:hypothetical protein
MTYSFDPEGKFFPNTFTIIFVITNNDNNILTNDKSRVIL